MIRNRIQADGCPALAGRPFCICPAKPIVEWGRRAVNGENRLRAGDGNTGRGPRIGCPEVSAVIIHVVKRGETVYGIARQYGVDPRRLMVDNGVPDTGALAVGQTLTIRFPREVYAVRQGDTLTSIARAFGVKVLDEACDKAAGLRLLNQDKEEMIFSFIISQNNNIPRIKGIISRICEGLGQKTENPRGAYYTFPSASALASREADYYKSLGAGYRDAFICDTARRIADEGISKLFNLSDEDLRRELLSYRGIGPKVADCISLFGFGRRACFPVDTWIEKLYLEDFGGQPADRKKINAYFTQMFGEYSGYIQQYLFYAKRSNL